MPRKRPSLEETYHDLPFAADADAYLVRVREEKPIIEEQLRMRQIFKLRIMELIFPAGIGIEKNAFTVYFNDLTFYDKAFIPRGNAFILGHEIGHTFHLDPSLPKEQQMPPSSDWEAYRWERFCHSFSLRWLDTNHQDTVDTYLWRKLGKRKNAIHRIPRTTEEILPLFDE